MDPVIARKTWRTLEPLHGLIYFAPEAVEEYTAIGLVPEVGGYFASRAAPMGAVPAEVVIATFYNFRPDVVREEIPRTWGIATPATILEARLRAAGRMLRRILGDAAEGPDVAEAAGLARGAAERATDHPEGRPLFAAHASLPWPDDPLLVLWHAQSLLREFRGDGHIAVLTTEGLSGLEALVVHGGTGEVPRRSAAVDPRVERRRMGGDRRVAPQPRLAGRGRAPDRGRIGPPSAGRGPDRRARGGCVRGVGRGRLRPLAHVGATLGEGRGRVERLRLPRPVGRGAAEPGHQSVGR